MTEHIIFGSVTTTPARIVMYHDATGAVDDIASDQSETRHDPLNQHLSVSHVSEVQELKEDDERTSL